MKLSRISPQSVKNIATILWLQKYKDKFLGSFNLEDTPEFGKRIAQAQLEACEEEATEKVQEIFNNTLEIDRRDKQKPEIEIEGKAYRILLMPIKLWQKYLEED